MAFQTPSPPPKRRNKADTVSPPSSQSSSMLNKEQIHWPSHVNDPVHGYISYSHRIRRIIDTQHFQRLRNLKQLGTSYYVFPGASHNRFEHSIGVMHLANKLIKHLKNRQPELCITDDEIFCVSAAGLLHDLGHGPFSHVFDNEFIPHVTNTSFRHEDMSVKLIAHLFEFNNIEINQENLLLIQALISPSTHEIVYTEYKEKQRGFLFEIVANELTGIDVDKWDYFLRDAYNTGISISFKYERLMEHCRVIGNHICWQEKCSFELYQMFRTRYELFKTVYSHKASKSIEFMICDILKYANTALNITSKINDPQKYLTLDDSILQSIQNKEINETEKGMDGLKKAKALIQRLHKRELYKCCGYLLLTPEILANHNPISNDAGYDKENEDFDIDDIDQKEQENHPKIAYHEIERIWAKELFEMFEEKMKNKKDDGQSQKRQSLESDDLRMQLMSLSFGKETEHPMNKAIWYSSNNPNSAKQFHVEQISTLGGAFREIVMRAYVKKTEWKSECEKVFHEFAKKKGLEPENNTDNAYSSLVVSPPTKKKSSSSKKKKRRRLSMSVDLIDMQHRNKKKARI